MTYRRWKIREDDEVYYITLPDNERPYQRADGAVGIETIPPSTGQGDSFSETKQKPLPPAPPCSCGCKPSDAAAHT
jgi:hypothetical protein